MIVVDIIIKLTGTDKEMKLLYSPPICLFVRREIHREKWISSTVRLMLDIISSIK